MKEYIYLFYVIGINYLLIRLTLAELDSLELDLPAFEQRKNGGVNKNFLRGVVGPVDNAKEHPNFLNEDDYDLGQGYGEMDTGEDDDSGMGSFGANLEDYGSAYSHFDSGPEEGSRGEFQPFPDEMRSHFGQRAGQFVGKLKGMVNNGIRSRFPPVYPVNHDEDDSSLLDIPDSEGDGQDNSDDNENEGDETPWYLADKNEPAVDDDGFTPFSLEDEFERPSPEVEPPRNSNIKETASSQNCSNNTQRPHKVPGDINRDEEANIQSEFGICGWILTILSYILIFLTLPISACMVIKVVQEFERAVIFRLGRLMPGGAKGPGIFFVIPCIDTYRKVDLRVLSFEVPPQEILSKDSVTVAVDAVVYFRISNATISVTNVEDSSRSTKLLAQTTLRNILGTKTLAEMLSDREAISLQMQATLDEATEPWGVKVERVEVKDVRLPVQLQRAMAAEAEAAREARAKVIVAEGEQKASRALKEASDVIAQSPQALQLRYLQTLSSISAEKNSTIIFPFPIDLLSSFLPSRPTQKPNTSEATKPHYS
ncbi:SPFH domain / band 7 family domain-containing protein [Ditylenchus destructor]|uniref:SPFH domain / band 7 family domain-containing protein n=1 Tax=Ditylenchus destructor TaxID=166010 RepID=A0AAD4R979_9BILA|nr:SPFH domain / band 7 family domain-containing protein [Ditylenchus destructor]